MKKYVFLSCIFIFLSIPLSAFAATSSECEKADQDIQTFVPKKPWTFNISIGTQYDSNVIMNPDGNPLPSDISHKADWREVADINAGYTIISNEKFQWTVGYNAYQSFQNRLTDFNVTSQKLDTTGLATVTPYLKVGLKYYFEYVLMGGNQFNQANNVAPAMVVTPFKKFPTVIEYRYKDSDYKDVEHYQGNEERTGTNKLVGLTQHVPILPNLKTYFSFAQDEEDNKQDFLSYKGRKFKVEMTHDLPKEIVMNVKAEYYKRDYNGVDPEIGKKRKDELYAVDIVLSRKIFKKLGITINLGYFYSKNSSNSDAFDFKRSVTSLFLNRGF